MNRGRRHLAYLSLLYHCLTLTEADAVRLAHAYGLPERQEVNGITVDLNQPYGDFASANYCQLYFQGIRSVPGEERKLLACAHLAELHDLEGVPGFYVQSNRWRLNLHDKGILRPYRDERGRILGLFIYRSPLDPQPGLLTSEGLYKGTAAIQPLEQEERQVA